jgi:hypothetical protein
MMLEMKTDLCSELYLQTAVGFDSRIDQLSMAVTALTISRQVQLIPASRSQISDDQQIGYSEQLAVHDCNGPPWVRKRPRSSRLIPVLSFSLILPHWLLQYSLQINVCRAAQIWSVNLRPYRTVPDNSELEVAIQRDDLDKVRHLIDSGQATVFDRNERGVTALHVCSFLHLNTALHLIDLVSDGSNSVIIR